VIGAILALRLSALCSGPDMTLRLISAVHNRASLWTGQLLSGNAREAAQGVTDRAVAGVVPNTPDDTWWATPLGRAVAESLTGVVVMMMMLPVISRVGARGQSVDCRGAVRVLRGWTLRNDVG
jgi:hypothetical protein